MWFICIALMCLVVFGDIADAKKAKSEKKSKEIKSNGKIDKGVKHHKEKYLPDSQKEFEKKKDKREAKHSVSS